MLTAMLATFQHRHGLFSTGHLSTVSESRLTYRDEIELAMRMLNRTDQPISLLAVLDLLLELEHLMLQVNARGNPQMDRTVKAVGTLRLVIRDLLNEAEKDSLDVAMKLDADALVETLFRILSAWTRVTSTGTPVGRGIPQGNDVSSFFGNICLIQLDRALTAFCRSTGGMWCRYVDDVKVMTKHPKHARTAVCVRSSANTFTILTRPWENSLGFGTCTLQITNSLTKRSTGFLKERLPTLHLFISFHATTSSGATQIQTL